MMKTRRNARNILTRGRVHVKAFSLMFDNFTTFKMPDGLTTKLPRQETLSSAAEVS